MKKIMSLISAVLVMFAFSSPITSIAKSAEFFTIGTGWTYWSIFPNR